MQRDDWSQIAISEGAWFWDPESATFRVTPRWSLLLEEPHRTDRALWTWLSKVDPADLESLLGALNRVRFRRQPESYVEYRVSTQYGLKWYSTEIKLLNPSVAGSPLVGNVVDITQLKTMVEILQIEVTQDPLTGLANRAHFLLELEGQMARLEKSGLLDFAVIFIDLSGFKRVNGALGIAAGDRILRDIGQRLREFSGAKHLAARLGGDEFLILLREVSSADSVWLSCAKIEELVKRPVTFGGRSYRLGVSLGFRMADPAMQTPGEYLRDSHLAMNRAKVNGVSPAMFYPEIRQGLSKAVALEGELREALDSGGLHLHYQPIFSMATRSITGFEALSRWTHGLWGPISPDLFIPLAEECGLIEDLGSWALHTAARQSKDWSATMEQPRMAINVSPREFRKSNFVERICDVFTGVGVSPSMIELEITETAAIQNLDRSIQIMRDLRDMGVEIALDDFGMGHSSLYHLKRLPVSVLKIDRAFVQDIDKDPTSAAIVDTIVNLATKLSLHIRAEGVESQTQLDLLHGMGCHSAQGYLLGRPMAAAEAASVLGLE